MLLCKKIARAPGGHKKYKLTKLGGAKQNRSEFLFNCSLRLKQILQSCVSDAIFVLDICCRMFFRLTEQFVQKNRIKIVKPENIKVLCSFSLALIVPFTETAVYVGTSVLAARWT